MRTVDLSPLYRSFIGFDHLAQLMDAASRNEKQPSFPPYNIEATGEDRYQITMLLPDLPSKSLALSQKTIL